MYHSGFDQQQDSERVAMGECPVKNRFGAQVAAMAFLATASTGAIAADKHPFGIEDAVALRQARATAVSPDGKSVLYDLTSRNEKGPLKHEWHMIDADGSHDQKLDLSVEFEPKGFTKDGALYGTYKVAELAHLAIVPLTSGKPTVIFALPRSIQAALISPDGSQIAVLSDARPKDAQQDVRNVVENDESSIYVVNADARDGAWWCPELKTVVDFAWSRDSRRLAVATQVPKLGNHQLSSSVGICGAQGWREVAQVGNATSGLAWSKDGNEIVFASTTAETLTPEHVWTAPASGGPAVDRTPQLEWTATTVKGDARGDVWVEMHKGVVTEAYTYADGQLAPALRWPGGALSALPVTSAFATSPPTVAVSVGDPQHAAEVAIVSSGALQKITHVGDEGLSKVMLGEVKVVHWTSKERIKLEGIATFPADYQVGKKYPFLVLPHGGPEGNDTLSLDIVSQIIAGKGYVVLQPQYRGSTGYGAAHLAAIYQHFGDRAYRDVDSATDFAIAQGWADPNRLAIFGWSAGGFMTSWTVTQTHRYRAAIEGAGITDWLSFIPTSDTWQTDYDARLQEKDPAPMLKFSAVMHADQVTTPLLILHGAADVRVPTFQGHEFYALLKERGKIVRMVTYPGSPHFPVLSEQQRDVFNQTTDWLAKFNP
jgi:dipeptidyl aminopeptidase/acylaminoacyl peptidase